MRAPCKECTDRAVGCHGGCERYRKYRADLAAAKAEIYGGTPDQILMLRDMEQKRMRRIIKQKHEKKEKKK